MGDGIKTMKLYTDLDRIANELRAAGYSLTEGTVPADVVHKVTMMSYSGVDGCKEIVSRAALKDTSRVLDIGCGIGGPGRVVADVSGGAVTGVEYQADLAALSNQLSARCGLDARVHALHGDGCDKALLAKLEAAGGAFSPPYDAAMSWLVVLHIPFPAREQLWANAAAALRPGALLWVEDYYMLKPFDEEETQKLAVDVAVPEGKLPSRSEYVAQVEAAGFTDVEWIDMTETWTSFVASRQAQYEADKQRHSDLHGETTFERMNHFYTSVVSLFKGGNLGGVRLVARRK